ncbi:hypothetical protein, partial [Bacillus sp. SIMBA_005]
AIGAVLGHGMPHPPLESPSEPRARIVIALCSEQGFVGAFNERILDYSQNCIDHAQSELMLVGTRGELLAKERRCPVLWNSPAASHADDVL